MALWVKTSPTKTDNSCLIPKICMCKERTGSCNFWPFHVGCNGYYVCTVHACACLDTHRDRVVKMWKQAHTYLTINTVFPHVTVCICLYSSKFQDFHSHRLRVVIVHTVFENHCNFSKEAAVLNEWRIFSHMLNILV